MACTFLTYADPIGSHASDAGQRILEHLAGRLQGVEKPARRPQFSRRSPSILRDVHEHTHNGSLRRAKRRRGRRRSCLTCAPPIEIVQPEQPTTTTPTPCSPFVTRARTRRVPSTRRNACTRSRFARRQLRTAGRHCLDANGRNAAQHLLAYRKQGRAGHELGALGCTAV